MRWRLFATLAEAAGDTAVTVDPDGAATRGGDADASADASTDGDPDAGADASTGGNATVGDAFEALLDAHPALESEVLDDDGELVEHVRLLHEGRDPFAEAEGFETPVDDDDELALFPPVSGG